MERGGRRARGATEPHAAVFSHSQRRDGIVRRQRTDLLVGKLNATEIVARAPEGNMTAEAVPTHARSAAIHPRWVRITHWINAIAMLVMIGSGWEIYTASPLPIFPVELPKSITLGGGLPGALAWHFAAMWIIFINGITYVTLGIVSGRFRAKLFPI